MSVEDELQIPPDAYLPASAGYSLKVSNGSCIELSRNTSLRSTLTPRCLVVGRQAATADLRIQHGSISRKHAVFYFMNDDTLILQEFGGKHGTHVNGQPIKGSATLEQGDTVQFGNVRESIFTVRAPAAKPQETANMIDDTLQQQVDEQDETGTQEEPPKDEEPQVAITRDDREAQIAAMVASFDEKPIYQKYTTSTPEAEEQAPRTVKQVSVAQQHGLPITQEFHIDSAADTNTKHALTSLVVDKSGSRFAVGHGPYLRLYDFSGMDRQRTTPFKTIIVEEGYTVEHVCYSNTGDRILVGTASPQPTIFDRDGEHM